MTIQYTQGVILPKEKGTVISELNKLGTTRHSAYISNNETQALVAGSFVEIDPTATGSQNTIYVKKASATTSPDLVYMIVRNGPVDDVEFSKTPTNYTQSNNCTIVQLNGLVFMNETGDVFAVNDPLMIDDTDNTRSTLIPFVASVDPAPTVYAIARSTIPSTASAQIISFKTIK